MSDRTPRVPRSKGSRRGTLGGAMRSLELSPSLWARVRGLLVQARAALPEGRAIAAETWARRHRAMLVLVWIHVPVILIYAIAQGKGVGHGFLEASVVIGAGIAAAWGPDTRAFRS